MRRTILILIDEVQHVFDKKAETTGAAYWFADFVKATLLDGARVPVVLSGIDSIWRLFQNPQLEDRRYGHSPFTPLSRDAVSGWERLRIVVESYERAAAFPERGDILGDGVMERFDRATGSALRSIYKLFQKAVEIGTRAEARCIDMNLLALAHAKLASPRPNWFNAFSVPVLPPLSKEDDSRRTKLHARKK